MLTPVSQNASKVTHIKGTLLDQAVILFNCGPFQNGNFSLKKEFAPRGSEFFLVRAVPYGMEINFYHIRLPPLNVTIYITHSRTCVMRASPMITYIGHAKYHYYHRSQIQNSITAIDHKNVYKMLLLPQIAKIISTTDQMQNTIQ